MLNDLTLKRYAVMIVFFEPEGCPVPSIFDTDIPKIYTSNFSHKGAFSIALDNHALAYNAMKRLKENGAKRGAILGYGRDNPILLHARTLLTEFRFKSRPEWTLGFDDEKLSEPLATLMFTRDREQRPDGLFIADDNFTEYVARGIIACGIKVPEELKIISHCNWSMPPKRLVPMELIGFDSRMIISEALHIIEVCTKGEKPESTVSIPPLLEG